MRLLNNGRRKAIAGFTALGAALTMLITGGVSYQLVTSTDAALTDVLTFGGLYRAQPEEIKPNGQWSYSVVSLDVEPGTSGSWTTDQNSQIPQADATTNNRPRPVSFCHSLTRRRRRPHDAGASPTTAAAPRKLVPVKSPIRRGRAGTSRPRRSRAASPRGARRGRRGAAARSPARTPAARVRPTGTGGAASA